MRARPLQTQSQWNCCHHAFDGMQRPSFMRCPRRKMEDRGLIMFPQIICLSGATNFCNSCLLLVDVIGLTCSNENRTRVHIQWFSTCVGKKLWSEDSIHFHYLLHDFIESNYRYFFVQDRFRFEFAIRISGWAWIVCADNFSLKS